jgi:hypothetical protein
MKEKIYILSDNRTHITQPVVIPNGFVYLKALQKLQNKTGQMGIQILNFGQQTLQSVIRCNLGDLRKQVI